MTCEGHACAPPDGLPDVVSVDGMIDDRGIRYIGTARRQPNGLYRVLADVGGSLCMVEARITWS